MTCPLFSNCTKNYDCSFCENFSIYNPIDKRVMSPAQLNKKAERKATKRALKNTEKSKRGRRSKRAGRYSENELVKTCAKYGYKAERMPLSGALKGRFGNDVHIFWSSTMLTVENKRRQSFSTYYKLVAEGRVVYIEGFCYLMDEQTFFALLDSSIPQNIETIQDKRFQKLHDFFDQDDADVVSMQEVRKPFMFAVPIERWEVICNEPRELHGD